MRTAPLPKSLSPGSTPAGARKRKQELQYILARLANAEFPRDYSTFGIFADPLRNETSQGKRIQQRWRNHFAQGLKVPGVNQPPEICPPALFLVLLQADGAKEITKRWEQLTSGIPSAKRKQAAMESVATKAAALFAEADWEEEQVLAKLRNELNGTAAFKAFVDAQSKQNIKNQKFSKKVSPTEKNPRLSELKPAVPTICIWSRPMTQEDYAKATGCALKTIQRFLKKLKALSLHRRHAAVAGKYAVETNLKILAEWIKSWVKNETEATELAAATIAFTLKQDPKFAGAAIKALVPVLKQRGLLNADFSHQLSTNLNYYDYPPSLPSPSEAFLKLLRTSPT